VNCGRQRANGDNRTVDGVTSERRNATVFGLEPEFDILNV